MGIATQNYLLPLPETDEFGTPLSKMPNCPHCGDDELGLMDRDHAVCNRCGAHVSRIASDASILDQMVRCNKCPWIGRVQACEPQDDGELCCPQCLNLIVVRC